MPPPPLPSEFRYGQQPTQHHHNQNDNGWATTTTRDNRDSWGQTTTTIEARNLGRAGSQKNAAPSESGGGDDFDEDWSEDDSVGQVECLH